MDCADKQRFIRQKAAEAKIRWSIHALSELAPDKLSVSEVETALRDAEIIEDYPTLRRHFPDCLILTRIHDHSPIHAVIAINMDNGYILVVTVYRPTSKEWQSDWRIRK